LARILCIDYGGKRTGLAVTDPLQIIATGLTTVDTKDLHAFIKNYLAMVDMGMKKKDRQNKKMVDEIAATIMLQEYLANR